MSDDDFDVGAVIVVLLVLLILAVIIYFIVMMATADSGNKKHYIALFCLSLIAITTLVVKYLSLNKKFLKLELERAKFRTELYNMKEYVNWPVDKPFPRKQLLLLEMMLVT